jgi:site-specific recombinase XerD
MRKLRKALETYLSLRRGLGAELRAVELYLRNFIRFLEREGEQVITTELALRWAAAPTGVMSYTWAQRLADVRRFASWLSATESRTEVPPRGLLPDRRNRPTPYIYSDEEIERIVDESTTLRSRLGLRAQTYTTLFALLAVTGLRIGEAVALDRDDVDLRSGILTIRRGKFGKSRFVPIHDSARRAIARYARRRDGLQPRRGCSAFFISERGRRITVNSAEYNFAVVSRAIGLLPPGGRHGRGYRHGRGPRLHDMRHRLAVKTLIRWYRDGRDVERELPKLSTYLGGDRKHEGPRRGAAGRVSVVGGAD